MLVRLRWFVLGALSTIGAGAYLWVRRMRERLTPSYLARGVADSLDAAARRVRPSGQSRTRG